MLAVGFVLGREYEDFRYVVHTKYSLPIVKRDGLVYSGFNMGAGENALFDIFSVVYAVEQGALIVIDEVELGLHVEAQRKLIEKLKDVCLKRKMQVIFTTHSSDILDALPPDARLYVESDGNETRVTAGISSAFAFSKLGSMFGRELDVLVEDEVARILVMAALPSKLRTRVTVKEIGSATSLARQLAASYRRGEHVPAIAVFDGDQLKRAPDLLSHAKKMAELNDVDPDFNLWFSNRSAFLPTDDWPESWLLRRSAQIIPTLAGLLQASQSELKRAIDDGRSAGKHNEIFEMSRRLGLERDYCLKVLAGVVVAEFNDEFTAIEVRISQLLAGDG